MNNKSPDWLCTTGWSKPAAILLSASKVFDEIAQHTCKLDDAESKVAVATACLCHVRMVLDAPAPFDDACFEEVVWGSAVQGRLDGRPFADVVWDEEQPKEFSDVIWDRENSDELLDERSDIEVTWDDEPPECGLYDHVEFGDSVGAAQDMFSDLTHETMLWDEDMNLAEESKMCDEMCGKVVWDEDLSQDSGLLEQLASGEDFKDNAGYTHDGLLQQLLPNVKLINKDLLGRDNGFLRRPAYVISATSSSCDHPGMIQDQFVSRPDQDEVFPWLTKKFSCEGQADLGWQFLCSIPVNMMTEFLPWLSTSVFPDEQQQQAEVESHDSIMIPVARRECPSVMDDKPVAELVSLKAPTVINDEEGEQLLYVAQRGTMEFNLSGPWDPGIMQWIQGECKRLRDDERGWWKLLHQVMGVHMVLWHVRM